VDQPAPARIPCRMRPHWLRSTPRNPGNERSQALEGGKDRRER
jgi:hypothetical protein